MTNDALPVVRLSKPAEWLQAVPYLFGFEPRQSLVVLGLSGPRRRLTFQLRVDLPAEIGDVPGLAAYTAEVLSRQDVDGIVVLMYGDAVGPPTATDEALWDALQDALDAVGAEVDVVDAMVVRSGRSWSLVCANPRCCPPEGAAIDPGDTSRVAAEMVLRGCVARESRADVEAEIAPVGGPAQVLVAQRCAAYAEAMWAEDARPPAWSARWADEAVQRWRDVLDAEQPPDADGLAALLVPLEHLTVRDRVAGVCLRHPARAKEVLRELLRRVPDDYAAAPATILGLLEWADGDGIRAAIAFDRALTADPAYSFAQLLAHGLQGGIRLPEDFLADIRAMGAVGWRPPRARSRRR